MGTFQERTSIEAFKDVYLPQPASVLYISSLRCVVCASLFPQTNPFLKRTLHFERDVLI